MISVIYVSTIHSLLFATKVWDFHSRLYPNQRFGQSLRQTYFCLQANKVRARFTSLKISIIVCLQTIIFLKEILKELEINFLLNLKIKSMTKIFFCNLCIYNTFTFVCNKSVRSPQSIVPKSKIWTIFASDLLLFASKQS